MTEHIKRRGFLGALAATGLATTAVTATSRSDEVAVTDAGIIHNLDIDVPDGFHIYNYARDKLPEHRAWDRKFVISSATPDEVKTKLRNNDRVIRGKSLRAPSVNFRDHDGPLITTRVSPTLGASTLVKSKAPLPAPQASLQSPPNKDAVVLSGPDVESPASSFEISSRGVKAVPAGSFTRQVKVTKLDDNYDRVNKWADCDIQRNIMVANRGKYDIVDASSIPFQ